MATVRSATVVVVLLMMTTTCAAPEEEGHHQPLEDVVSGDDNATVVSIYPQPIRYLDAATDDQYRSADSFDAKGMQAVYMVTSLFLDFIQADNLPKDIFDSNTTLENVLQVLFNKKEELLLHNTGMLASVVVGLLVAIVVLVAGFFFCACRCAGKCGARPSPYEKRYDTCKRAFYGLLLATLVILILFGIVCAFINNEYMGRKVEELPVSLRRSVDDVDLYLNNTKLEVNTMLVTNFNQLERTLDVILDRCGDIIKMHLAEVSRALAVENLTEIVSGLEAVREDLNGIVENTQRLQLSARQLENALNVTRSRLQSMLSTCTEDVCLRVASAYDLNGLKVRADFGKLPDVTDTAREISRLVREDIENEVRKGKESLDGIGQQIQSAVNSTIPQIKHIIRDVGIDLEENSIKIGHNIDEQVELGRMRANIEVSKRYIDEYSPVWYYALVGACSVILFINSMLIFGLFCGFCGRKPNYVYGDDSCTKGTGARCFMLAVYFIILFYFVLMVLTTALFVVGGITKRAICDPIVRNPNTSEVLRMADLVMRSYDIYPRGKNQNVQVSQILERCHGNKTIYSVLHLESEVNIDAVTNYKQRFRVREKIQELADKISISPSLVILTSQAKSQLQQLADSKLSEINFTKYALLLDGDVLGTNLTELMSALTFLADKLQPSRPDIYNELTNEVVFLKGAENMILSAMQSSMSELKVNLRRLEKNIKFNKASFKEWVQDLLDQAEKAQDFIQNQGRSEVIALAQKLADNFTSYLDEYANMVNTHVKEEIGKCWPVSHAVNASIVAVCKSILEPLNGYWASTGWCLALFIPVIFLAVYLSGLYHKTDLHALPSLESHVDKKRRRKNQVTYDNQNGYIHDGNPAFAIGRTVPTTPPTRRGGYHAASTYDYSSGAEGYELDDPHTFRNIPVKPSSSRTDLQDWDFQSEAPPRYSSATNLTSQDFERPPPYYYPGPSPFFFFPWLPFGVCVCVRCFHFFFFNPYKHLNFGFCSCVLLLSIFSTASEPTAKLSSSATSFVYRSSSVKVPSSPGALGRQGRKYSLPGLVTNGDGGGPSIRAPRTEAVTVDAPKDHYRVVVMGAPMVGKTAIISQFLYDTFVSEYKATVEEMHRGEYDISGSPLTLEILDTSGSNEFPAMRALSVTNADAFVLVYAVDDPASFDEVRNLREMILSAKAGTSPPTVVVGNKCDLPYERRQINMETAETTVSIDWEHGFVEASAKDNLNIITIFKELLSQANVPYALSPAVKKRRQSLPSNSPIKFPNSRSGKRNSCALS